MSIPIAAPRFVVITGAAGGIGRALVEKFSEAGYSVLASDIVDMPATLKCAGYIKADLEKIVNDSEYGQQIFQEIKTYVVGHGVGALVNNAAIQVLGGVNSLKRRDWRQSLDINLLAPFYLTQGLLEELELAKGSVVNISSIHAKLTKQNFVAYSTSKAALSGLTRAMAIDLGPRVRINAIEPAAIETEMLRAGFLNNPELYAQLNDCHPIGRIGYPEEVANLAVLLSGDALRFMHGETVSLSGAIASRLFDPD